MAEPEIITLEDFKSLVERTGMSLNEDELSHLKPMYEHFAKQLESMNELDLDAEDLAVVFSPNWDPQV